MYFLVSWSVWHQDQHPDARKNWKQEEKEKRAEEEETVRHLPSDGHEFEQALGDSGGQGSVACCGPRGHRELDTTKRVNDNNWQKPVPPMPT